MFLPNHFGNIKCNKTYSALLERLGAPFETPLSFYRALAGSFEIPPGTCLSLL